MRPDYRGDMSHDWQAPDAVAVGARGVWFQLGLVDVDAFERPVATGLPVVMDTCPAIEWGRRRA